ncbi:homeobox protein Mix.1-like [Dermacentor albipictus]|uniref:homeobox protein Mix.1-like n=1 Tax=Dermacentor albipictus TaxID=60249 RepID=UPI0038FCDDBD
MTSCRYGFSVSTYTTPSRGYECKLTGASLSLSQVAHPCDLLTTNMASPPATAAADGTRVPRAKYSRSQLDRLEQVFGRQQYIDCQEVEKLADELGITTKQTRTWFQNKRAMLRRRAIRIIGDSYVHNLQPPPGCPNTHPSPLASPRDTGDSRQWASPAVVPPATTVVCPGLPVQSQTLAGNETQPQQSLPSLGSFHTGHDFLAIPQPRWDGRVSRAVPSSAFPALSSGDERVLSASVQLRPNVAAPWNRQYGSFESLYPTRPPPPPLNSSLSHSAPCVSFGGGQSDRDYVQYQQSGVAAPASTSWQGQPQWPQVQLPQGPPASDVQQQDWWSPATVAAGGASADVHGDAREPSSWQTGGAGPSTSSGGSDESVPSMSSLMSLVLEMEDPDIEIERSRHWMNAADA